MTTDNTMDGNVSIAEHAWHNRFSEAGPQSTADRSVLVDRAEGLRSLLADTTLDKVRMTGGSPIRASPALTKAGLFKVEPPAPSIRRIRSESAYLSGGGVGGRSR